MKDSIPEVTRSEYLNGDVTPKVRVTIRRTRLDFGAELYYKNDSTVPGIIVDLPPVVEKPTAAFRFTNADGSPPGGTVPLTVTVIDESLGDIDEWLWEFGDGETSTSSIPGTHTYENVGTYTASLTVTNAQGSDKFTRYGYITGDTPGTPLEANFRFTDPDGRDPPSGAAPLTVDVINESVGSPTLCVWTYGDGGGSTNCTPGTYTFDDPGIYTAALTAKNAVGDVSVLTKEEYVTVTEYVEPPDPPDPGDGLFVSTLGSNSTGDGSINNPWKTITYGKGRMSPGDTLYIRAGEYYEMVDLSNMKGSASAWYTIKSYPLDDSPAIITGRYTLPGGPAILDSGKAGTDSEEMVWAPLVKINNSEYVELDGIHVTRSRGGGIDLGVGSGKTGKHITFTNCHVYSCRSRVTHTEDYDNITFSGGAYYDSMNYCTYRRATIRQGAPWDLPWSGAMTIHRGSGHLVENVLLHTSYGEGIHPFTWGSGIVRDSIVFNCMNGMLPITCCAETVIERNFVYSTRDLPFAKTSMLNVTMEAGNTHIRRGVSKNCRLVNNIIIDGYSCNRFMDRLSSPDGVYAYGFYRNSIISHNTFVQHASSTTQALIRWIKMHHTNDIKTIDMCNNVYWCQGPGADIISVGAGNPQPKYRYNNWYPKPTESMAQGAGDINDQDPKLVNVDANLTANGSLGYDLIRAQADKYKLTASSPGLGQGRNTKGDTYPVDVDFWGNARGTSPCMGAHERS